MSDDFKARDVQFFSNFKKVKFKSYNVKNCRLSQSEMIKIIETYRYRPFNDRIAYLEVYTSNKIEGNLNRMTSSQIERRAVDFPDPAPPNTPIFGISVNL